MPTRCSDTAGEACRDVRAERGTLMQTMSNAPGRVAVSTLLVITLVVLPSLCSTALAARRHHRARSHPAAATAALGRVLVGRATWYGPGFHGRRTASGERFNRHALTLASRGLP